MEFPNDGYIPPYVDGMLEKMVQDGGGRVYGIHVSFSPFPSLLVNGNFIGMEDLRFSMENDFLIVSFSHLCLYMPIP